MARKAKSVTSRKANAASLTVVENTPYEDLNRRLQTPDGVLTVMEDQARTFEDKCYEQRKEVESYALLLKQMRAFVFDGPPRHDDAAVQAAFSESFKVVIHRMHMLLLALGENHRTVVRSKDSVINHWKRKASR